MAVSVLGCELLDEITAAICAYVVAPDGAAETAALWSVHTHALDCFTISPRLAITSAEKQSGKTTLLDVLTPLVRRSLLTGSVSTAALFRVIELAAPTLLIDEADTFLADNNEIRGVLNSGHRKGGSVLRTVGDDHEPRMFSTWSPVAIAMIGRLPDTLQDRSVPVRLCRRKSDEAVALFRIDRTDELEELARKAARWVEDNQHRLRSHDPDTGSLFNRTADNWRPLLTIADIAGGEWPARARQIAEAAGSGDAEQSTRVLLLKDAKWIFDGKPDDGDTDDQGSVYRVSVCIEKISSADLAQALAEIEGRPWAEWRHAKPITANALARQLAHFGIIPVNDRYGGKVLKGYRRADFEDVFARYLSEGVSNRYTATSPVNIEEAAHSQPLHGQGCSGSESAAKPKNDGRCSVVAFRKPYGDDDERWLSDEQ